MKSEDKGSYHLRKYFDTYIDKLKIEDTQNCASRLKDLTPKIRGFLNLEDHIFIYSKKLKTV